MKIAAQEEFGLRIMLRIAQSKEGVSINDISLKEGITKPNVAKICRVLRMAGFITSEKGHTGGYQLSKEPSEINMKELLNSLDKPMYHQEYCAKFSGETMICSQSVDCSVRSLWALLQFKVDEVLVKLTLADFLGKEEKIKSDLCNSFNVEL